MHNLDQGIHQLPPEVLSRIFILGHQSEHITTKGPWYLDFQDILSQVCGYWRSVALNTPTIWTRIRITRPANHHLASLYISRTNPTHLLDIDMEIRSRFWSRAEIISADGVRIQNLHRLPGFAANSIYDVFNGLGGHPACFHRWRSLSICTNELQPLFIVLHLLCKYPAPELACLHLKWKRETIISPHVGTGNLIVSNLTENPHFALECEKYIECELSSSNEITLSNLLAPNLRFLKLDMGISYNPKTWHLFKNLTRLDLTAYAILPNVNKFVDMLSQNPLLEVLHLDMGPFNESRIQISRPIPCVCLRSLHTFSLRSNLQSNLTLLFLITFKAPNVRKFTLAGGCFGGQLSRPAACLAKSISSFYTTSTKERAPVYNLYELDISSFHCHQDGIIDLLNSMPLIRRLSICGCYAQLLEEYQTLPRLSWLTVKVCASTPGVACHHLERALSIRAEEGYPNIIVRLLALWKWWIAETYDPKRVFITAYSTPMTEPQYPESENEEDNEP